MKKEVDLNLSLALKIVFDTDTDEISVVESEARVLSVKSNDIHDEEYTHILGHTEVKFGILTFGARSPIGMMMPNQREISVIVNGETYTSQKSIYSHKSVKGRIDGLTKVFREYPNVFKLGAKIKVSYDQSTSSLEVYS